MPRVADIYSRPAGIDGIPNATIESADYNLNVADVEADLNLPRPIVAGGTGATSAAGARDNLDAEVSMKQVTDYNTHVWEPGSFFSFGSATAPPVAGQAFTGICYGIDANNMTVEARNNDPAQVPGSVYVRQKRAGVWDPAWTIDQSGIFVAKTGDTMTGDLIINKANPAFALVKAADGQAAAISGSKLGSGPRWSLALGDSVAETGGNLGSNFVISRFSDAAAFIDQPLVISRQTGFVSMTGELTVTRADPRLNMTFTGATAAAVTSTKSGSGLRWSLALGNGVAETGANAGSNFGLARYTDAGTIVDVPIAINRADGAVQMSGGVAITAAPNSLPGYAGSTATGVNIWPDGLIVASRASGTAIWGQNADGAMHLFNRSGTLVGSISVTTTATAYNTSSDERLKEDLKSFNAGNIIDDTMVYDFAWKATGERAYGVIAQQAITVYDAPVFHDEKEDRWFVDYSKYVPVILQELKALRARVAELEGRLEAGATPA